RFGAHAAVRNGPARVKQFVSKLHAWWQRTTRRSSLSVPYEVACRCGQLLHGQRQARFQAPRCPQCGRAVFVLPQSALPPINGASPARASVAPPTSPARARRDWPGIVTGVALGVIGIVVALFLLLYALGRNSGTDHLPRGTSPLTLIRERMATGSK